MIASRVSRLPTSKSNAGFGQGTSDSRPPPISLLPTLNLGHWARVMCALLLPGGTTSCESLVLYDDVRKADSPTEALAQFFESTYEAAADLLGWNRSELERMPKLGG